MVNGRAVELTLPLKTKGAPLGHLLNSKTIVNKIRF